MIAWEECPCIISVQKYARELGRKTVEEQAGHETMGAVP